jgi:hypothetical protein
MSVAQTAQLKGMEPRRETERDVGCPNGPIKRNGTEKRERCRLRPHLIHFRVDDDDIARHDPSVEERVAQRQRLACPQVDQVRHQHRLDGKLLRPGSVVWWCGGVVVV